MGPLLLDKCKIRVFCGVRVAVEVIVERQQLGKTPCMRPDTICMVLITGWCRVLTEHVSLRFIVIQLSVGDRFLYSFLG